MKKISVCFVVMTLNLISPCYAHSWPTFRNGFTNRGLTEVPLRSIPQGSTVRVPNQNLTKGLVWGTPTIDRDGNVFVGSADKTFYSFSSEGKVRWTYRLKDEADSLVDSAAALTEDGLVIVPGGDGYLHALDADDGKLQWTFKATGASDTTHSTGVIVNSFEGNVSLGPQGLIYAGSDNGMMYAVDHSGKEVWHFQTNMMIWSAPAFSPSTSKDEGWMVFGSLDGRLYLLDALTGTSFDQVNLFSEIKTSPCLTPNGRIIVGSSDGMIRAFQVKKGLFSRMPSLQQEWQVATDGEVYSSAACDGKRVYVGSHDGKLRALDEKSGQLVWAYNVYTTISSSPAVSTDGVVLFGARNGKLYAIEAETGTRLWSYRTTRSGVKANLDSSVSVDRDGLLHVGSYSGKIFNIPYEFCLKNVSESACEFGGNEDLPDFGGAVPHDGAVLRVEDREGKIQESIQHMEVGSVARIRLVAFENGKYIPNASINPLSVSVKITPSIPFDYRVSSDGSFINVYPTGLFDREKAYQIRVTGEYFHQQGWLIDRLKWLFLKPFAGEITLNTSAVRDLNVISADKITTVGVRSLFLFQPRSLETYTPAALDGQAFVGTIFAVNPELKKFLFHAWPAYPTETGVRAMPEPARSFMMAGRYDGDTFRADGSFKISAMGGEIKFDHTMFSARLDESGVLKSGEFFAQASCLSIKGNGSSYTFPLQLVDLTCDHLMRLIGLGKFEGSPVEYPDAEGRIVGLEDTQESWKYILEFEKSQERRMLVAIPYDSRSLQYDTPVIRMIGSDMSSAEIEIRKSRRVRDVLVMLDGRVLRNRD